MVYTFEDLGKESKDLFDEHYNFGQVKIDVKNKVSSRLGFDFTGNCNSEDGKVTSALETKYDFSNYGFLSKFKWTTDNDLLTEVVVSDYTLLDGFKVFFNTKMGLVSNKKSGSIKASMDGGTYNVLGDLQFESGTPKLNASGVYKYNDFLLGYSGLVDVKGHKVEKQSMSLGFVQSGLLSGTNMSMLANFENLKEVNVGIYKQISSSVQRGVQLSFDEKSQAKLAFGIKHIIDASSALKAKVNSEGKIGLAYIYQYQPGVKCSISTNLEAQNLMAGGHKVGLGLTFEG